MPSQNKNDAPSNSDIRSMQPLAGFMRACGLAQGNMPQIHPHVFWGIALCTGGPLMLRVMYRAFLPPFVPPAAIGSLMAYSNHAGGDNTAQKPSSKRWF